MNTTKSIDDRRSVNPNTTKTGTKTGTETPTDGDKPAGYVKIAAMTTAAQYLASCGGASAKGLKLRAQLLWWHLVMLGGPILSLEDGRAGSEVYGYTSRIAALAERMNASESTVRKAMAELVDAGLIRQKRTTRGMRRWVLLPDAALKAVPTPSVTVSATHSDDTLPDESSGDVVAGEPVHASPGGRFHASPGGRSVFQIKSQTKIQTTTTRAEVPPSVEVAPRDGGGGGVGVQDQGDTEQTEQVRSVWVDAGVWETARDELTAKVLAMPDGPDRLDKTYARIRSTTRSPAAALTAMVGRGELDELTELDRRELSESETRRDFARRGETLGQYLDRLWVMLDHGDALHVAPLALQRLIRSKQGSTDSEDLGEHYRVKAKGSESRREYLFNLEQETEYALAEHRRETRSPAGDAIDEGERFRASDAMRAVLGGTKFTETKTPNPLAGLASVSAPSR